MQPCCYKTQQLSVGLGQSDFTTGIFLIVCTFQYSIYSMCLELISWLNGRSCPMLWQLWVVSEAPRVFIWTNWGKRSRNHGCGGIYLIVCFFFCTTFFFCLGTQFINYCSLLVVYWEATRCRIQISIASLFCCAAGGNINWQAGALHSGGTVFTTKWFSHALICIFTVDIKAASVMHSCLLSSSLLISDGWVFCNLALDWLLQLLFIMRLQDL